MTERAQSEALLRAVIEGTSDVVYVQDLENRYLVINPAGARMLGKTVDEVIGHRDSDLFPAEEAAAMAADNAEVVATGKPLIQEFTVTLRGEPHVFQTSKTVYRDDTGRRTGVIGVCRDISELKLAEAMLTRHERLSSIGTLTAGIAHSLNNSLAPVVGLAEVLLSDPAFPSHLRESARSILAGATDAADTVKRLQRFSTLKTQTDPPEAVNLSQAILHVVESTRPHWMQAGVRIETNCAKDVVAFVDPSELRQTLTHLVRNALEAMTKGGILSVSTQQTETTGIVTVRDTGIGMSEEQYAQCQLPFYTTKSDGAGLGLSVCYGTARRFGGELTIQSKLGLGTAIHLSFPSFVRPAVVSPTHDTEDTQRDQTLRVLVVDDDIGTRETFGYMIRTCGHEAVVAASGQEGLAQYDDAPFDVVLTDVGMPGMDGFELGSELRSRDRDLPVFVITGWWASDVETRSKQAKFHPTGVLEKPVTLDALAAALATVPSRAQAAQ